MCETRPLMITPQHDREVPSHDTAPFRRIHRKAIQLKQAQGCSHVSVLDVGSGSGLVAMIAAR